MLKEFSKHFHFKSGCGRKGRPPKVKDKHCVLGLLLHTYCSPADGKTWCELFGLPPATLYRYLDNAEAALDLALQQLDLAQISWPTFTEQRESAKLVRAKDKLIKGRFGFVDGKNYSVQEPTNSELQNAMYNGWLHAVLITNVVCFGVCGCIIWARLNFYGSWNDAAMSMSLRVKLANPVKTLNSHGLLADTAFLSRETCSKRL